MKQTSSRRAQLLRVCVVMMICCAHVLNSTETDKSSVRNANFKQPPSLSLKELDEMYSLCNGIDIREITIMEIQNLFESNALTSIALTNCYLDRIYMMNRVLKAVIEVNPDAIELAYRADLERGYAKGNGTRKGLMHGNRDGNFPGNLNILGHLPTLHGVPVLLKDNIATFDKMETTSGSLALLGIRPKNDAAVVAELRKAGAVIIGKANLSEFAGVRLLSLGKHGWSSRGGQTLNAYNTSESPQGSSSGSASAVAANLATVSVGTDTDGSLTGPATAEGICTIRPTFGLVSTKGVIPISYNQDTIGPMSRTIIDMTILFDAMLPASTRQVRGCRGSFLQCIWTGDKEKLRLGILRSPFLDSDFIRDTVLEYETHHFENIFRILKSSKYFNVLDPVNAESELLKSISPYNEFLVLTQEFKHDINDYLRNEVISPYAMPQYGPGGVKTQFGGPIKKIASLKDIIQFNTVHPSPEGFGQDQLIEAEKADDLPNEIYKNMREMNFKVSRNYLDSVLIKYNLDAVLVPLDPRVSHAEAERAAALSGYPSLIIPAGIGVHSVPLGLNLIGRPYTEGKLFRMAYIIEQMTRRRRKPEFLN